MAKRFSQLAGQVMAQYQEAARENYAKAFRERAVDVEEIERMEEQCDEEVHPAKHAKKKKQKSKKAEKMKTQKQLDEEKAIKTQQAREKQYAKLEESKARAKEEHHEERNRLTEAMLMAEIIGMPKCKTRYTRGSRRNYGR